MYLPFLCKRTKTLAVCVCFRRLNFIVFLASDYWLVSLTCMKQNKTNKQKNTRSRLCLLSSGSLPMLYVMDVQCR